MNNNSPSFLEQLGNVLAFAIVLTILGFGAYAIINIVSGESELISLGEPEELRPTTVVVLRPPTLTPFEGIVELMPSATATIIFLQPTAAPPSATVVPKAATPILPKSSPISFPTLAPSLTPAPVTATSPPIPSATQVLLLEVTQEPTLPPLPTDTPLPADTPSPTDTPLATTTPLPTVTSLPTVTPLPTMTPLPTQMPLPTVVPPTETPAFLFQAINVGADFSRGCPGHYIFGYVRNSAGAPLPGYLVRVYNQYGYEIPASTSKVDPPGGYDVPISGDQALWYVLIVDAANNPLSPVIEVQNTGNFVEGSEGCWHQIDFVRAN